jgi:hypothetical protein
VARKYRRANKAYSVGSFHQFPRSISESPEYLALSGWAKLLLMLMVFQYDGSNNGSLNASWAVMRTLGFRSEGTLNKALHELLAAQFIIQTLKSRRPIKVSDGDEWISARGRRALYAITWERIDNHEGEHGHEETDLPLVDWIGAHEARKEAEKAKQAEAKP